MTYLAVPPVAADPNPPPWVEAEAAVAAAAHRNRGSNPLVAVGWTCCQVFRVNNYFSLSKLHHYHHFCLKKMESR